MLKKLLLLCAMLPALASPAAAQTPTTIRLVSSSPADGSASVPLTATVSLTFNVPIPENEDLGDYIEVEGTFDESFDPDNIAYSYSADRRTVTAEVVHAPDEDYFIYAVPQIVVDECSESTFEVEPFIVQYTTASALGTGSVSGTVTLGDDIPAGKTMPVAAPNLAASLELLRAASRAGGSRASTADASALIAAQQESVKAACSRRADATADVAGKTAVTVEGSWVALVEGENLDSLAGLAFVDASGNYTIEHVRPGTYHVVGFNFGGIAGLESLFFGGGIVGAYDPDGDGEPNPLTVGGSVGDVDLTLHLSSRYAVSQEEAEAEARAAAEAETGFTDLELIGAFAIGADLEGNAVTWSFTYHSPGNTAKVDVGRNLFFHSIEVDEAFGDEVAFPEGAVTAAGALEALQADATGQAFFAETAGTSYFVQLVAGPPITFTDEESGDPVWTVNVYAFTEGETRYLSGVVDLSTGAVIQIQTFPGTAEDYLDYAAGLVAPFHTGTEPPVLYHISGINVNPETGEGAMWDYGYKVDLGGSEAGASAFVTPTVSYAFPDFTPPPAEVPPVPATRITSEQALAIAEDEGGAAFRQHYAAMDQGVSVHLEGGYARDLIFSRPEIVEAHPEIGTTPVWAVTYATGGGFLCDTPVETDSFIVVLNMETGAVIAVEGTAVANEPGDAAGALALSAAYPNPTRGQARIEFTLTKSGRASVEVYNVLGQRVAALADGVRAAGSQSVTWHAANLPSGVYFVRLEAEGRTLTSKVVLQR